MVFLRWADGSIVEVLDASAAGYIFSFLESDQGATFPCLLLVGPAGSPPLCRSAHRGNCGLQERLPCEELLATSFSLSALPPLSLGTEESKFVRILCYYVKILSL